MNKRQRKKHGVAKLPSRRRRTACAVAVSCCGNVFKDLDLPDADRLLEGARIKSIVDGGPDHPKTGHLEFPEPSEAEGDQA